MHDDSDDAPQSTLRLKTKPWIDRKLEQLATECEAGLITPHEMMRQMLDACDKWAAPYLTRTQRAQVRETMEDLAFAALEVELAWDETE